MHKGCMWMFTGCCLVSDWVCHVPLTYTECQKLEVLCIFLTLFNTVYMETMLKTLRECAVRKGSSFLPCVPCVCQWTVCTCLLQTSKCTSCMIDVHQVVTCTMTVGMGVCDLISASYWSQRFFSDFFCYFLLISLLYLISTHLSSRWIKLQDKHQFLTEVERFSTCIDSSNHIDSEIHFVCSKLVCIRSVRLRCWCSYKGWNSALIWRKELTTQTNSGVRVCVCV